MSTLIRYPKKSSLLGLLLGLLLLLVGCHDVRLVGPYDQFVDDGVSQFHTDITAFIGKMLASAGKPEGTYETNKGTYPEFAAALSTISMRAAQAPKNEITVQSLAELTKNVELLRKVHESNGDKGLTPALAGPAQSAIDVQCESILKFEIAKKRGDAD